MPLGPFLAYSETGYTQYTSVEVQRRRLKLLRVCTAPSETPLERFPYFLPHSLQPVRLMSAETVKEQKKSGGTEGKGVGNGTKENVLTGAVGLH